jgi:hypothetical protein
MHSLYSLHTIHYTIRAWYDVNTGIVYSYCTHTVLILYSYCAHALYSHTVLTHYTLYSLYTVLTIHCTHYTLYSLCTHVNTGGQLACTVWVDKYE